MTEAKLASRHSLRVYLEMLIIVLKALWEENKKLIGIESLLYSSTLPRHYMTKCIVIVTFQYPQVC